MENGNEEKKKREGKMDKGEKKKKGSRREREKKTRDGSEKEREGMGNMSEKSENERDKKEASSKEKGKEEDKEVENGDEKDSESKKDQSEVTRQSSMGASSQGEELILLKVFPFCLSSGTLLNILLFSWFYFLFLPGHDTLPWPHEADTIPSINVSGADS